MRLHSFTPPHPGLVLKELCLEPQGLSLREAAQVLGVSRRTLSALVKGEKPLREHLACKLAEGFGPSAESWLRQQRAYDLWVEGLAKR